MDPSGFEGGCRRGTPPAGDLTGSEHRACAPFSGRERIGGRRQGDVVEPPGRIVATDSATSVENAGLPAHGDIAGRDVRVERISALADFAVPTPPPDLARRSR